MASRSDTEDRNAESGFFHLPWGDVAYIVAVLAIAVVAFLPWAREASFSGVAMLGWLMAGLMVAAPLIALLRIIGGHRRGKDRP